MDPDRRNLTTRENQQRGNNEIIRTFTPKKQPDISEKRVLHTNHCGQKPGRLLAARRFFCFPLFHWKRPFKTETLRKQNRPMIAQPHKQQSANKLNFAGKSYVICKLHVFVRLFWFPCKRLLKTETLRKQNRPMVAQPHKQQSANKFTFAGKSHVICKLHVF